MQRTTCLVVAVLLQAGATAEALTVTAISASVGHEFLTVRGARRAGLAEPSKNEIKGKTTTCWVRDQYDKNLRTWSAVMGNRWADVNGWNVIYDAAGAMNRGEDRRTRLLQRDGPKQQLGAVRALPPRRERAEHTLRPKDLVHEARSRASAARCRRSGRSQSMRRVQVLSPLEDRVGIVVSPFADHTAIVVGGFGNAIYRLSFGAAPGFGSDLAGSERAEPHAHLGCVEDCEHEGRANWPEDGYGFRAPRETAAWRRSARGRSSRPVGLLSARPARKSDPCGARFLWIR
jgi:hypothetical protein